MKLLLGRLSLTLCAAGGVFATGLHIATFITIIPPVWVLVSFGAIFLSIICAQPLQMKKRFHASLGKASVPILLLFVYAIALFAMLYRATGGATSVGIENGQYVYRNKGRIVRTITEDEYGAYPNLVTRVITAWLVTMAANGVLIVSQMLQTAERGQLTT